MSLTLTRSREDSSPATVRNGQPAPALDELRAVADRLGQMDLDDPRWPQMAPLLDACLLTAVANHEGPRADVWREIATDAHSPLVVKLRTLAMLLRQVGCDPAAGVGRHAPRRARDRFGTPTRTSPSQSHTTREVRR
jgi:hypothetical protein